MPRSIPSVASDAPEPFVLEPGAPPLHLFGRPAARPFHQINPTIPRSAARLVCSRLRSTRPVSFSHAPKKLVLKKCRVALCLELRWFVFCLHRKSLFQYPPTCPHSARRPSTSIYFLPVLHLFFPLLHTVISYNQCTAHDRLIVVFNPSSRGLGCLTCSCIA